MKRSFAIFCILLYLAVMIQPVIPVIDYLVRYDYIVAELCENRDRPELQCDGKCYLKKQLEQDSGEHPDQPVPPMNLEMEEFPIAFPAEKYLFCTAPALMSPFAVNNQIFSFDPPHEIFHPPEFQV